MKRGRRGHPDERMRRKINHGRLSRGTRHEGGGKRKKKAIMSKRKDRHKKSCRNDKEKEKLSPET